MALVDITAVEPQGADLVDVQGTVDGVPVRVILKRADIVAVGAGQRRRFVAAQLRDALKPPFVNPFAALIGQETL